MMLYVGTSFCLACSTSPLHLPGPHRVLFWFLLLLMLHNSSGSLLISNSFLMHMSSGCHFYCPFHPVCLLDAQFMFSACEMKPNKEWEEFARLSTRNTPEPTETHSRVWTPSGTSKATVRGRRDCEIVF